MSDILSQIDAVHRELGKSGDAHRMIAQRQDVAKHADFYFLGSLAQRRGDQVGRGHGAIGAVVMLVENHAVEA